jgi:hypothetical protein
MDASYVIAKHLGGEKKTATGWRCLCPIHDDHAPSLYISYGDNGKLLFNCRAGCDQSTVFNYIKDSGLLPPQDKETKHHAKVNGTKKEIAVYHYTDPSGAIIFDKVRYEPKSFASRFTDSNGKVVYSSGGQSKTLYLRHTLNNLQGRIVVIVEGEKDADFVVKNYGLIATTVPNGASTWDSSFASVFTGADVLLCPDNDAPGKQLADKIIVDLLPISGSLKLITLPSGKDISEWGGDLTVFMEIVDSVKPMDKPIPEADFDMRSFAISLDSCASMRKKMLDDVFIMRGLALLGDITVIYAKPNAGKTLLTLWMLVESCKSGVIVGNDVLYINADDSHRGLVEKTELVSGYGIGMLSPGINGFQSKNLIDYIDKHISSNTAKGLIIILDTMKKFTDTMDKKISSGFTSKLREFSVAGGSVIMLAHANKHRDSDGKLVACGTSDIPDDVDCTYFLDELDSSESDYKHVVFENSKSRGENQSIIAFSHLEKEKYRGYTDLFLSVRRLSHEANKSVLMAEKLEKYSDTINAIKEVLKSSPMNRGDIVKAVMDEFATPRREILKVIDLFVGKFWKKNATQKREVLYSLIIFEGNNTYSYSNKGSFYD